MIGTYLCSAGESFDSVALAVYGDEKFAAELLMENPELVGKLVFSGGERLRCPEVETEEDRAGKRILDAPWKG